MTARETKVPRWTRYSICGLLVIVAAVAIAFAIRWQFDPLFRYRLTGSTSALVDAIRARLANGMDREKVTDLLGEPVEKPNKGYVAMVRKVAPLNRMSYPDGFRETDEFLSFACESESGNQEAVTLQFRDGKLINFAKWQYDDDDVIDGLE